MEIAEMLWIRVLDTPSFYERAARSRGRREHSIVRPHAPLVRTVGPCAQGREALALARAELSALLAVSASHGAWQPFILNRPFPALRHKRAGGQK